MRIWNQTHVVPAALVKDTVVPVASITPVLHVGTPAAVADFPWAAKMRRVGAQVTCVMVKHVALVVFRVNVAVAALFLQSAEDKQALAGVNPAATDVVDEQFAELRLGHGAWVPVPTVWLVTLQLAPPAVPAAGNWIRKQLPVHVRAAAGDARLSMMSGAVQATAPVAAARLMSVRRSIPRRPPSGVSISLISRSSSHPRPKGSRQTNDEPTGFQASAWEAVS
jgi:hypothetical protein